MESMGSIYYTSTLQEHQYMASDDDASIPESSMTPTPTLESADTFNFPLGQYYLQALNLPFSPELDTESPSSCSCSSPELQIRSLPFGFTSSKSPSDGKSTRAPKRELSEENGTLTPAQSRRKAQNRAAQRAFRERKEKYVKDIEAELEQLTKKTSLLQSHNARLRLLLQRAQTENGILRATMPSTLSQHHSSKYEDDTDWPTSCVYSTTALEIHNSGTGQLSSKHSSPGPYSGRMPSGEGRHLLSASATWDLIQSHPLYVSGVVDMGQVCEKLRKMARGNDTDLMFDEEEVRGTIEDLGGKT